MHNKDTKEVKVKMFVSLKNKLHKENQQKQ